MTAPIGTDRVTLRWEGGRCSSYTVDGVTYVTPVRSIDDVLPYEPRDPQPARTGRGAP